MYSLVAHYENLKNLGYWIGCEIYVYIYIYICIYIDWLIIWSFPSHGWAATNVKACYDICRVYIWQPQLESKNLRIFFFGSYIENDLVGSSNFSTILIFVIRCSVKNQNFHLYATCLLVRRSWSWRGYVISLSWCLWWQTGVDAVGSIFYWVSAHCKWICGATHMSWSCTFKLFLEYNLTRFRLICVLWVACTVDCRGSFVQVWPRATWCCT